MKKKGHVGGKQERELSRPQGTQPGEPLEAPLPPGAPTATHGVVKIRFAHKTTGGTATRRGKLTPAFISTIPACVELGDDVRPLC